MKRENLKILPLVISLSTVLIIFLYTSSFTSLFKNKESITQVDLTSIDDEEVITEKKSDTTKESYNKLTNVYKGTYQELLVLLNKPEDIFNTYKIDDSGTTISSVLYSSLNSDTKSAGLLIYNNDTKKVILNLDLSTSSEMFVQYPMKLEIRDINNDKKSELLVYWNDGSNEPYIVLKIFTIKDNLEINPVHIGGQDDFGGIEITFSDLDGDKIEEIIRVEHIWNQKGESKYDIEAEIVTSTYKWSGTEYVLWKEQKEPFVNKSDNI